MTIIRLNKSMYIKLAGHIACIGKTEMQTKFILKNWIEGFYLRKLCCRWKILLNIPLFTVCRIHTAVNCIMRRLMEGQKERKKERRKENVLVICMCQSYTIDPAVVRCSQYSEHNCVSAHKPLWHVFIPQVKL